MTPSSSCANSECQHRNNHRAEPNQRTSSPQVVKFHLTNINVPFSCLELPKISDMKKTLFLSTLTAFAMICSCQKQDSAADAQLAQRKTELDAREEAVVQREKAVDAREKEVAEREKALANSRIVQPERQTPDAAQAEAERQRRIQQLSPELKAFIPDRSQIDAQRAQKDREKQQQSIQRQQDSQNARQGKLDAMQKWQTSGAPPSSGAQTSSPTPSSAIETETESPTPQ